MIASIAGAGPFPPADFGHLPGRSSLWRHSIEVPDVRGALPDETLRSLRDDAERLRELTGRDFATWSIWET